jgi:hypothetical protein
MDQTVRALVFTRCPRRRPSAATRHIGPAGRQIGLTKIARLIYRVKYKTTDGDRQVANAYYVGLLP